MFGDANGNRILGLDGDDVLYGSPGNDIMNGGNGVDAVDYGASLAAILVNLSGGVNGGDAQGDTLISIENVYGSNYSDIITGDGGSNTLVGGVGNDNLNGGAGNDILDGRAANDSLDGGVGSDALFGGAGDDLYSNVDFEDTVTEYASEGDDEVRTALSSYTLTANVERLTFTDSASHQGIGNAGNNVLTGNVGQDRLFGQSGNDTLIGGAGSNELQGGTGNDSYIVSIVGDAIIEYANEGFDEIRTALASFSISANVEVLTYTGAAQFVGVGNVLDNVITGGTASDQLAGGDGNDTLDGRSTLGGQEDVLVGGIGNDIFIVGLRGTTVVEFTNEGIDEVRASSSVFVLPNNVENLTYTGAGGFIGFGNALDNMITGGTAFDGLVGDTGNDTINGGAGAANELIGGIGNDTYIVLAGGDTIIEYAAEGADTVSTALANYTLRPNVENLVFTGTGSFGGVGSADDNSITGGASGDTLVGNDGNDVLTGGSGADLLIGGNGADQFRYVGGDTGYDRITDFTSGSDKVALANAGFVRTATLAFVSSAAATANSANSTFLYDTSTGIVSYDADGTGASAAVQLAQLNTGLTLALGDFIFV